MRAPVFFFAVLLSLSISQADGSPTRDRVHARPLTADEQAAQVVDRFTFGPTPGMAQAVAATGWEQWFSEQLQPETIPDSALEKRLADYPSLAMSPAQLAVQFPDGQVIRRIAEGKQAMPADPQLAGAYQVLLERYQEKQAKNRAGVPVETVPANAAAALSIRAQQTQEETGRKAAEQAGAAVLAGPILAMAAPARLQAVLALPVADRMQLTRGLSDPLKTELLQGVPPRDRELWSMMAGGYGGNGVAAGELEQAKVLRAVLSERQLQEVMTDFWVNHFNIDLGKSGDEILYTNQFEQSAIRPHALGKFRDLLLATAQSPAMMIYLDNRASTGADSQAAGNERKGGARAGLNENYGREVMELHTLGVDGGYTQADVTALANILTGWGVDQPQQGGPFAFQPRRHEPGPKQWLGHTVQEGGEQEGIDAIDYLASQPATARHISFELAQRFVADAPPPALVDRMAATWAATDGNIAEVLRTMVHSPEFFNRSNFRSKIKSPLEFVASAMRATETDPTNPGALVAQIRDMGEPLYHCQPPTGYPNTGERWMNSAALVQRLNFALALSEGKVGGMRLNAPLLVAAGLMAGPVREDTGAHARAISTSPPREVSGDDRALALMKQALITGELSPETSRVIHAQLAARDEQADAANPTTALNAMAAMLLGSPEFQVH